MVNKNVIKCNSTIITHIPCFLLESTEHKTESNKNKQLITMCPRSAYSMRVRRPLSALLYSPAFSDNGKSDAFPVPCRVAME